MNKLVFIAAALAASSCGINPASAWERKTVGDGIEGYCESRFPDYWNMQTSCINAQWEALKGIRPPQEESGEFRDVYEECKRGLTSEYDFRSLAKCMEPAEAAESARIEERLKARQREAAQAEMAEFATWPLVATCKYGDDVLTVRALQTPTIVSNVAVQVGDRSPMNGFQTANGFAWDDSKFWVDASNCKLEKAP